MIRDVLLSSGLTINFVRVFSIFWLFGVTSFLLADTNSVGKTNEELFQDTYRVELEDPSLAFEVYQKLVGQGHVEAKVRLSALLQAGLGEGTQKERIERSLFLLKEAAAQGSVNAYFGLSVTYYSGLGVPENKPLGIKWLKEAAEGGEPRAQHQLAYLYEIGQDMPRDHEKALFWYKASAGQNYEPALFSLANIFLEGTIVEKNVSKSIDLLTQGATAGHSHSILLLGNLYFDDSYGIQDGEKAFYWLTKSAESGSVYGQTGLGSCYRFGVGTEINNRKAFYWYKLASDTGQSPIATFKVAEMYVNGLGVEPDLLEARRLFTMLAEQGDVDSEEELEKIDRLIIQSKVSGG